MKPDHRAQTENTRSQRQGEPRRPKGPQDREAEKKDRYPHQHELNPLGGACVTEDGFDRLQEDGIPHPPVSGRRAAQEERWAVAVHHARAEGRPDMGADGVVPPEGHVPRHETDEQRVYPFVAARHFATWRRKTHAPGKHGVGLCADVREEARHIAPLMDGRSTSGA